MKTALAVFSKKDCSQHGLGASCDNPLGQNKTTSANTKKKVSAETPNTKDKVSAETLAETKKKVECQPRGT